MKDKKISGASAEPRIDEIILPGGVKADYTADAPYNSLVGIKRLNAFVGPNNSGKSRLLRELFVTAQNLMVASTVQHSVQIRSAVRSCIDLLPAFESQRNHLIKGVPENLVSAPFGFHEATQHFASFDKQKTEFKQASENLQRAATEFRRHNPPAVSPEIVEQLSTHLRTICRGIDELATTGSPGTFRVNNNLHRSPGCGMQNTSTFLPFVVCDYLPRTKATFMPTLTERGTTTSRGRGNGTILKWSQLRRHEVNTMQDNPYRPRFIRMADE